MTAGGYGAMLSAFRQMTVPAPLRLAVALLPILLVGTGATAVTDPAPGKHPPRGEYLIDVWQVEDGLPRNQIQAMVRTRDGYLWLGTSEGLVRFDGIRFRTFNQGQLKVNNVHALLQDRQGRLWIGTYGAGLYVYEQGRFTAIGPADGLGALRIRSLFEDRQGRRRFLRDPQQLWPAHHGLRSAHHPAGAGGRLHPGPVPGQRHPRRPHRRDLAAVAEVLPAAHH